MKKRGILTESDEYELISHKEIATLRKEILELRAELRARGSAKGATAASAVTPKMYADFKKSVDSLSRALRARSQKRETGSSRDIKDSVDQLSASVNRLVELFTVADEIGKEQGQGSPQDVLANQHMEQLKSLVEQNRAIAKGILAITEIVGQHLPKIYHSLQENPKYKILRIKNKIGSQPGVLPTPARMTPTTFSSSIPFGSVTIQEGAAPPESDEAGYE